MTLLSWVCLLVLTILISSPSGVVATLNNKDPIQVTFRASYLGPECSVKNWVEKLTIECTECQHDERIEHCTFPVDEADPRTFNISCAIDDDTTATRDVELNCSLIDGTCDANCQLSFVPVEDAQVNLSRPRLPLMNTVACIVGTALALISIGIPMSLAWWYIKKRKGFPEAAKDGPSFEHSSESEEIPMTEILESPARSEWSLATQNPHSQHLNNLSGQLRYIV